MDIGIVPQLARNSVRFREVVSVLAKYGLANWLGSVRADWVQQIFSKASDKSIRVIGPN